MGKYKVEIDSKLPSEEKIKKSMDFEKVLKTATSEKFNVYSTRQKMHKRRNYVMWTVVVIAVLLSLFVTLEVI